MPPQPRLDVTDRVTSVQRQLIDIWGARRFSSLSLTLCPRRGYACSDVSGGTTGSL